MLCRKHNFRRQINEPSIKGRTSSTAHSPGGGGQFTADLFLFAKVPEEESAAAIVAFPIEEDDDDDEDEHTGGDTDTHGDHVLSANARNQSKIRCAVNVSVFTVKGWPNRISHHDV